MMDNVDKLVQGWVQEQKIPGGVLSVTIKNKFQFFKAYGAYSDGKELKSMALDTIFDLASLTKVVSTLPAILTLAAADKLSLEHKVKTYIPSFNQDQVTIRHLLMHSSGLPADLPAEPRSMQGRRVLDDVLKQELLSPAGQQVVYSDLGMILLGEIISTVSGESLEQYVRKAVFEPLGMTDTRFNPDEAVRTRTAATEFVDEAYIVGEVHDEKCYHLGGVSGSAGLFSSIFDLAKYADFWLDSEKGGIIPLPFIQAALSKPLLNRGLGWEVLGDPQAIPYSCGTLWGQGSFGHTGFTGTSLWIDPSRELIVVFLTNAVHFGRNNPIRHLRRQLHDEIFSSLFHS
ncbi:CubicO group peptidase, beta-lactamase class C family [Paenibacillus sp. 1_12]|uniref:serine hydrolase domain-containing protein n=1 Tax=Paenibacillus sp. 1_12 TaxID=1566278 RepID=UPI0008F42B8E|nr:serine hydrolase domain-containing protein [Paenibacillus sp. 1_12]SFM07396.1 CubicO group peptidase, beta-lactamase class C family [Paenibacillus sp. 1_12]